MCIIGRPKPAHQLHGTHQAHCIISQQREKSSDAKCRIWIPIAYSTFHVATLILLNAKLIIVSNFYYFPKFSSHNIMLSNLSIHFVVSYCNINLVTQRTICAIHKCNLSFGRNGPQIDFRPTCLKFQRIVHSFNATESYDNRIGMIRMRCATATAPYSRR